MPVITVSEFGGPEVMLVTDAELPKPGPGEVLVRVLAARIGPWDVTLRSGYPLAALRPRSEFPAGCHGRRRR